MYRMNVVCIRGGGGAVVVVVLRGHTEEENKQRKSKDDALQAVVWRTNRSFAVAIDGIGF